MRSYSKPWLSVDDQIDLLRARGLIVDDRDSASDLLSEVGYYRLTGYLYPFRRSSVRSPADGGRGVTVEDRYRDGTSLADGRGLLDFDRALRALVLEAVERIEVAVRTRLASVMGRCSPFAHEERSSFTTAFTSPRPGPDDRSEHRVWLDRLREREVRSDESFVRHFRERYDGRMPIWVVTELLEFGQVSRLYGGLRNDLATEVATGFDVPTKRLMRSWLAAVNYVRNVAAHQARLFNRKLVVAPKRPTEAQVPALAHLTWGDPPKQFGVYDVLAVMAHLLDSVPSNVDWQGRVAALLASFPEAPGVDVRSTGLDPRWLDEPLWRPRPRPHRG